jgi:putative ABC transport system permease protein
VWRDLKYAAQAPARDPLFTAAATLALGLAIGANGAIFGVVDALWFRPPGVRDTATIVRLFATTPSETNATWSYPEYLDIRDRTTGFAGVAIRGRRGSLMTAADGSSELLLVNVVSTNFFQTLGVTAAHGRVFAASDDAMLESQPAIVLGHAFWQDRFGGDPSIVGAPLRIGRGESIEVRVLGVLPASFRDLDPATDRDLWLPTQTWARLGNREEFQQRDNRWFDIVGRRRANVSVAAADAEVAALAAGFARAYPAISAGRDARVVSDRDYRLGRGFTVAVSLFALVTLVVLITCVNVANLLLARAAARGHELAVRVALGAGRWRLLRQLLTESALLGGLGAIAGATIAAWLIALLPALISAPPGGRSFVSFQTDNRVLLFTSAVTLVTTVLFGLVPSWIASRADIVRLMKEAARTNFFETRITRVMVAGQIAVSLVLVCVAGVLVRSFIETRRADIGVARKPLLTIWTTFGSLTPAAGAEAVRQLGSLPGVTRVALAIRAPLSLSGGGLAETVFVPTVHVDSTEVLPRVKFGAVSSNYFEALGTRIVRGRPFADADQREGEPAVIVNEQFARQFFPGHDALGERVRLGGRAGVDHRIVGIAENAVINAIGEKPEPYVYGAFWRSRSGEATFIVDGLSDPAAAAPAARDLLRRIDPRLEPRRMVAMADYISYSASIYKATAALAGALAVVGLLLTAVGVYAVVAFRTRRRAREIGIRVALGAARGRVVALVMRDGAALAALGVGAGVPLTMLATQAVSSMLFGIGPWDAVTLVGSAAVLLAAVCLASFVPAWRAARVDPAAALRDH